MSLVQGVPIDALVRVLRSFEEYNAFLAFDIGSSNVRCGIVKSKLDSEGMVAKAKARLVDVWRHGDKKGRETHHRAHGGPLRDLEKCAGKFGFRLAPSVCAGCPGIIGQDGVIHRETQNLHLLRVEAPDL